MKIRLVHPDDLQVVTQIEAACFPAAEAAPQEELLKRIQAFPTHFWILEEKDKPIGFINGMVTDNRTICDEMFENAFLHRENGAYQSVFGLDVLPEYRCKGYAAKLMQTLIDHAKNTFCIIMQSSATKTLEFPLPNTVEPPGMTCCWNSEHTRPPFINGF